MRLDLFLLVGKLLDDVGMDVMKIDLWKSF